MGDRVLSIGLSGLTAAQAGLLVTGHNISNVNTPGYNRQEALLGTEQPLYTGAGYFGAGAQVNDIRRVYNDFAATRLTNAQADASALDALQAQLAQLDSLVGDPNAGLAPALDEFFSGINALAARPADPGARQVALSGAQSLVSRFRQIDSQFAMMRDAANRRVDGAVNSINDIARQIALLNARIMQSPASATSSGPNDLLDQRDALVAKLNEQVGARAVVQGDGSYNIFLSNGYALVVGSQAGKLAAIADPESPGDLQVAASTGGALIPFRSTDLAGGAIGGTLEFRNTYLAQAQNELGRVAASLAIEFNAQHALGIDLNGAPGGTFFSVPAPVTSPSSANTGTGTVTTAIVDVAALAASDYVLRYDGSGYELTRLADGSTQVLATLPASIDGMSIALSSGAPAAGDVFVIQPVRMAADGLGLAIADPSRIAAASPIRTEIGGANVGTGRISAGEVDASYLSAPLGAPVTMTYASGTGQLTGFPLVPVTVTSAGVSTTYPAGQPVPFVADATLNFGGMSFTLSGAPADGDVFVVRTNPGALGDGRNAQGLAALAGKPGMAGGTTTFHGAYASMVSGIGAAGERAALEGDVQKQIVLDAKAAVGAASGVNLDEEAANLQRYQQAYLAAGKLIAIAGTLFQTILGIGNA